MRVGAPDRAGIGVERAIEFKDLRILAKGFGEYRVPLGIRFTANDLGLALGFGDQFDNGPVGLRADPLRRFIYF